MLTQKRKNWLSIIAIMATLVLVLAACGGKEAKDNSKEGEGTDSTSDVKQVLNLSTTSDFTSLDIHHAADAPSFDALYQIGAGLIGFDKEGNFIPNIAADDPEVNDDLTVYTFTIRDDAEWENGDPGTANEFVYSWKRDVNAENTSEYAFIYENAEILNAAEIMNPDSDLRSEERRVGKESRS